MCWFADTTAVVLALGELEEMLSTKHLEFFFPSRLPLPPILHIWIVIVALVDSSSLLLGGSVSVSALVFSSAPARVLWLPATTCRIMRTNFFSCSPRPLEPRRPQAKVRTTNPDLERREQLGVDKQRKSEEEPDKARTVPRTDRARTEKQFQKLGLAENDKVVADMQNFDDRLKAFQDVVLEATKTAATRECWQADLEKREKILKFQEAALDERRQQTTDLETTMGKRLEDVERREKEVAKREKAIRAKKFVVFPPGEKICAETGDEDLADGGEIFPRGIVAGRNVAHPLHFSETLNFTSGGGGRGGCGPALVVDAGDFRVLDGAKERKQLGGLLQALRNDGEGVEERLVDLQRRAEQERLRVVGAAVKIQAVARFIIAQRQAKQLRAPKWIRRGRDWIQSCRERLGPVTRRGGGAGRRVSFAVDLAVVVDAGDFRVAVDSIPPVRSRCTVRTVDGFPTDLYHLGNYDPLAKWVVAALRRKIDFVLLQQSARVCFPDYPHRRAARTVLKLGQIAQMEERTRAGCDIRGIPYGSSFADAECPSVARYCDATTGWCGLAPVTTGSRVYNYKDKPICLSVTSVATTPPLAAYLVPHCTAGQKGLISTPALDPSSNATAADQTKCSLSQACAIPEPLLYYHGQPALAEFYVGLNSASLNRYAAGHSSSGGALSPAAEVALHEEFAETTSWQVLDVLSANTSYERPVSADFNRGMLWEGVFGTFAREKVIWRAEMLVELPPTGGLSVPDLCSYVDTVLLGCAVLASPQPSGLPASTLLVAFEKRTALLPDPAIDLSTYSSAQLAAMEEEAGPESLLKPEFGIVNLFEFARKYDPKLLRWRKSNSGLILTSLAQIQKKLVYPHIAKFAGRYGLVGKHVELLPSGAQYTHWGAGVNIHDFNIVYQHAEAARGKGTWQIVLQETFFGPGAQRNAGTRPLGPFCSEKTGFCEVTRGVQTLTRAPGGNVAFHGGVVCWDGNRLVYPHRAGFRPVSHHCHSRVCAVHITVSCQSDAQSISPRHAIMGPRRAPDREGPSAGGWNKEVLA